MATFLVTGGAGFIGSHLADRLLGAGHRVLALDDLSTGSEDNVAHLRTEPRFELTRGSIFERGLLASLVDRCDGIFHLAAAVGVRLVVESPTRTIETNVLGTAAVLEAAVAARTPLLLASSSEVYGKRSDVPFREADDLVFGNTQIGRWSYGCSKAIDEYLALAYARERGLPVVVARLFNTVGPRQSDRYGMVLPTFVRQGLRGEDITVYGSGEQRRCFGDVHAVVECLVRLIGCADAPGQVFNLGCNREISIQQLAERVRDMTGGSSEIVKVPYEEAYEEGFEDLGRRVPDVEKLRRTIGMHPDTPVETIIQNVIDHMQRTGEV